MKLKVLSGIFMLSSILYCSEFKYEEFDYKVEINSKSEKIAEDRTGEIDVESTLTENKITVKYSIKESEKIEVVLGEKERKKVTEIMQKYLAWAGDAERKNMKMDKTISKIEKVRINIERNGKKSQLRKDMEFNLVFYDEGEYYFGMEFIEVQGKKAEKIYFNRDQVIEMLNKINEEAIKDGITLYEINNKE